MMPTIPAPLTTFCPLLGRHWRVGDRVVVTAEHAPDCRHGEIVRIDVGGAVVQHDDESFVSLLLLGRGKSTWGWGWSELEPEPQ